MTLPSPRTWLVTGASRGLGRAFAEVALESGESVVATARKPEQLEDLVAAYDGQALALALDVTDRGQVQQVVEQATAFTGRLDVLVNNAGYGLAGGVEEASEQEVRDQFEVNVFGALWCTQAVLPVMRTQGAGHLFQISSIGGVAGFLNTGIYHASKWALEGFSESLAQEVAPFGIGVTIVEPGPFRTDWNGDSMTRATPLPAYDEILGARRAAMDGSQARTQAGDPRKAAEALLTVLNSPKPPRRLLLGALAADVGPATYHARLQEWAEWDTVARGADF
ncbi:MAG: SDR family NAD(P)-dependent oxidoreductase [Actinobacteria bacterium]|nr:SDR family NAD(P)-dependent oxidoreductase [Actinomycetota bacterium]MCA1720952.1 SDR family NAD(P)-dependent oxidoreductase [Actinomycetota bacterium]